MEPFKNYFDERYKKDLANLLAAYTPNILQEDYFTQPTAFNDDWNYRKRVEQIALKLFECHSENYLEFYEAVKKLSAHAIVGKFRVDNGFFWEPFTHVVQYYGLAHPELSFKLLELLTQLFTAEFAIRPFIDRYPEKSFEQLKLWSRAKNEHLRRLSSEGSRPRLPWGKKIPHLEKVPDYAIEILSELKDDKSLYVRKSVANHLNDLSWVQPDLFYKIINRWNTRKISPERAWIIKHALRSEIKKGNPKALEISGVKPFFGDCRVELIGNAQIQQNFELLAQLTNSSSNTQKFIADIILHMPGKTGARKKVFKGWKGEINGKATIELPKRMSLVDNSVRKYYPGAYAIEILVNGNRMAKIEFEV
ncbi:MAG: hypothetical protein ACPF8V_00785 [Luteibaculum sp.]